MPIIFFSLLFTLIVWRVKYLYAREIIVDFIERVGSARLLKYSKVLELDKKIRSFNPQGWESRPPSPSSRKTFDIVKCLVLDYMRDTSRAFRKFIPLSN